MTKRTLIFIVLIVLAAVITSLLIQGRAQSRLRETATLLRQQENQLAELAMENQRLSNPVVQTGISSATTPEDHTAELAQLRTKVEALRNQAHQLAKQLAENRRLAGVQFFLTSDFNLLEYNRDSDITFAGGPRATGKLNDARALTAALRRYADDHQGEFGLDLNQLEPYLPKALDADSPPWADAPLTATNDFEIVYQGSRNDLSNIPPRRVALIRERQPWLTPDGKWARVYGYADGAASIVESDDNFQSWDAQHVVPPSDARQ
jgi:hypothetical protein